MADNPLSYNEGKNLNWGRKPRECIPNMEREAFIKESAKVGESKIGLRQKNRYIDEFLIFVKKTYGITDVDQLAIEHVLAYKNAVYKEPYLKDSTKRSKISRVGQWLKWLHASQYIAQSLV